MNEALEQLMMQKLLLQPGAHRLGGDHEDRHHGPRRGGGEDMIAREGTIPAVEAKMHNPIFNIRENLRRRYEEEAYASGMQREVIGKVTIIPRRGGAILPPDRQGQPARDRRPIRLRPYHQVPQVDRRGQAPRARASVGDARTHHHGRRQVRPAGAYLFGRRFGAARRRNGACDVADLRAAPSPTRFRS